MSLFICPICQSPLQPAADTWRCDGSLNEKQTIHPFDVARQGYVNLLPVQQKKSKAPGDSQQSIEARQRFLTAGYYQPLQELICQKMAALLSKKPLLAQQQLIAEALSVESNVEVGVENSLNGSEVRWLDIGCGDGYYTQAMAQITINANTGTNANINIATDEAIDILIAADISKPALVGLAKVSKAANRLWYQQEIAASDESTATKAATIYPLVTSAAHLPLRAHSMTGISSIFSPILPEAFAEVLEESGYLVIAKPDIGHLTTLREALFDSVREHDSDKFLPTLAPYFELLETHLVSTPLSLSVEALSDLLTMTPYAYRAHLEKRQALMGSAETEPFVTEAKFVVYILQKKSVQ